MRRLQGSAQGQVGPAFLEIVVPACNEADRLPGGLLRLCSAITRAGLAAEVIVVDNGSTDDTARIAGDWTGPVPVRVVRCATRGKGAAVRAGLLATTAPYVGFCDADMATDLSALTTAVDLLSQGRQVVVGSRRHPESVVEMSGNPIRRLGAIVFNRLCRGLAGGIGDTQCGFKFFAGPLARAAVADLRTTGFAFDVELLMRCSRRGAQIEAIPVRWRDVAGSTFSVRRHSLACARDLARIGLIALRVPEAPALPRPRPVMMELSADQFGSETSRP